MAKQLGPTFGGEVVAAGAGIENVILWRDTDETIMFREKLTAAQNTTLDGVIAAHDPTEQPMVPPTDQEQALFEHENRLRALEGQPAIPLDEYMTSMKGQSDGD
jgi:hypothetical protein